MHAKREAKINFSLALMLSALQFKSKHKIKVPKQKTTLTTISQRGKHASPKTKSSLFLIARQ